MDKITRRSFLKGTLAGTAAVAAMGLGGVSALAEQPTYTPGTYTARAQGYANYVTVVMTFSEHAITACTVDARAIPRPSAALRRLNTPKPL